MLLLLCLIGAYLFGSLSSAILACKIMGLPDPRTQGSKNPGATNVMRIAGKKLAVMVLLGDMLKGVLPILLARYVGLSAGELSWVAFAAFFGHLYPVFFGFRGGKGVATAIGVLFALVWPLALAVLLTWLVILLIFRYVSLASIVAAAASCIYAYWLAPQTMYLAITFMSILLIVRHCENIQRLLQGNESKFGKG